MYYNIATYINENKPKTTGEAAVLADGFVITHKNRVGDLSSYAALSPDEVPIAATGYFVQEWMLLRKWMSQSEDSGEILKR